jgi:hypothetical protein
VVREYFECLKEGNVQALRTLMGGELLKERTRAMSSDRYPDFLRKYFRGAVLQSVILEPIDHDTNYAELHISQGKNLSFILLKISRKNHSWLVTEEVDR